VPRENGVGLGIDPGAPMMRIFRYIIHLVPRRRPRPAVCPVCRRHPATQHGAGDRCLCLACAYEDVS